MYKLRSSLSLVQEGQCFHRIFPTVLLLSELREEWNPLKKEESGVRLTSGLSAVLKKTEANPLPRPTHTYFLLP